MSGTRRISAPAALVARLDALAAAHGRPVEELIDAALTLYVTHQEAFLDAVRAGAADADAGATLDHAALVAALAADLDQDPDA